VWHSPCRGSFGNAATDERINSENIGRQGGRMNTKSISSILHRWVFATVALSLFSSSASAIDLTVFGGIQHPGQLTFQSTQEGTSNFIKTFDPKTFGVYGARLGHGKTIGGEHTFAYAPNFVDSTSHAFIYHSNLRIQAPLPVVKPYGTVGVGIVHSAGNPVTSFGTEFALNYGGGVKLTPGPIGVNFDVRGYTLPRISVGGFHVQDHLNFIQVSAGVVFAFE
jgi:hypothetical protein